MTYISYLNELQAAVNYRGGEDRIEELCECIMRDQDLSWRDRFDLMDDAKEQLENLEISFD